MHSDCTGKAVGNIISSSSLDYISCRLSVTWSPPGRDNSTVYEGTVDIHFPCSQNNVSSKNTIELCFSVLKPERGARIIDGEFIPYKDAFAKMIAGIAILATGGAFFVLSVALAILSCIQARNDNIK